MKRFIITSTKFYGSAELLYNFNGVLIGIDTSKSDLEGMTLMHFKHSVPVQVDLITTAFSSSTTIVEAEFEVSFDMFWNAYSKKINKPRCKDIWSKLSLAKRVAAWQGIAVYDNYLKVNSWRKKCDPETYLKKESWENEWE